MSISLTIFFRPRAKSAGRTDRLENRRAAKGCRSPGAAFCGRAQRTCVYLRACAKRPVKKVQKKTSGTVPPHGDAAKSLVTESLCGGATGTSVPVIVGCALITTPFFCAVKLLWLYFNIQLALCQIFFVKLMQKAAAVVARGRRRPASVAPPGLYPFF